MNELMKRREFIALVGGAAAAWPLAAKAQQPAMPLIGFLDPTFHDTYADRLRAFRQGLKDTGYIESEKVTILYRSSENQFDRLPELATELIRRHLDAGLKVLICSITGFHKACSVSVTGPRREGVVAQDVVQPISERRRPGATGKIRTGRTILSRPAPRGAMGVDQRHW